MLMISWTEIKINMKFHREMGKEYELINILKARTLQYLEHIMRREWYEMFRLIMKGKELC